MGDRRQGDRRQTSVLQKQIAISLKELVYLCIIFVLIVTNIITYKISFCNDYSSITNCKLKKAGLFL